MNGHAWYMNRFPFFLHKWLNCQPLKLFHENFISHSFTVHHCSYSLTKVLVNKYVLLLPFSLVACVDIKVPSFPWNRSVIDILPLLTKIKKPPMLICFFWIPYRWYIMFAKCTLLNGSFSYVFCLLILCMYKF